MRNEGKCWKCDKILVSQPGDVSQRITNLGSCANCGQDLHDASWITHLESLTSEAVAKEAARPCPFCSLNKGWLERHDSELIRPWREAVNAMMNEGDDRAVDKLRALLAPAPSSEKIRAITGLEFGRVSESWQRFSSGPLFAWL